MRGAAINRRVTRRRTEADLAGVADYRSAPGGGWEATVTIEAMPTIRCRGGDPQEVARQVQDALAALTRRTGLSVATVHQLDGDDVAWAALLVAESCSPGPPPAA